MATACEKKTLLDAHKPHWGCFGQWVILVLCLVVTEILLAWTVLHRYYGLAAPLILLAAHFLHVQVLALHEAAHGTLCPHRGWNEVLGVVLGINTCIGFSLYRAMHHFHHAYLATERDEELWPFVVPTTPRWARRLAAALELVFGLAFTPFLFWRAFLRKGSPIQERGLRRRIWAELALSAAHWAAVAAVGIGWNAWRPLLLIYVLPVVLTGQIQAIRKYVEHMGLMGPPPLGVTRSIVPSGRIGRLLAWSLFNVGFHGIHHRFPRMQQTAMAQFIPVLAPGEAGESAPYPSYLHAFWDMVRSLADPRIGTQWRSPKPLRPLGRSKHGISGTAGDAGRSQ